MRIRLFKDGNPLRRKPKKPNHHFAWLPKRLDNGTIVWLEPYVKTRRYSGYGSGH